MAAPTYGAAGTYRQGSSASPAFDVPDGVVANSVVVLDMYLDAGATISALPSGFVHVTGSPLTVNPGGGGEHKLVRAWKRASGTESTAGTYTVTLSANVYSNGVASRADGCVTTGDPWDTNSGTGAAAATDTGVGSGVTPAVSMTTQNADQLNWFSGTNWSGGAWTPVSGFTERLDTGDATLTVDTRAQAVAGTTGSLTATCASADRRAALIGSLLSTALSSGDASVSASTVAATATVGTPTLQTGQTITAVKVSATAAVGAPTISLSVVITPATVAAAVTVGAPAVQTGTAVSPVTVAAVASVGAPSFSIGQTVTAAVVAAVATVGAPSVTTGGSASVSAVTVAAVATVGAPSLRADQTVTAVKVSATASVGAPTIALSLAVTPASVAAAASVGTPTFRTSSTFAVSTVLAAVTVGVPVVSTSTPTGLVGNAHGPLPLALGSITVHTGTIAGAVT